MDTTDSTDTLAGEAAAYFQEQLVFLLKQPHPDTGRPWTNRQVSEALERYGVSMSGTQVWKLRHGKAAPKFPDVVPIARVFDVDPSFFLADSQKGQELDLLEVLRKRGVTGVAARNQENSAQVSSLVGAIEQMITAYRELQAKPGSE